MKWFCAKFGGISEVEVERETGKFVVFPGGRREAKDSDWQWYRSEYGQARECMIHQYQIERDNAAARLANAEKKLAKAQSLAG